MLSTCKPDHSICTGDLQPTSGEFRKGRTLRVGRYAQHFVDALQMDDTPVEYLQHKYPSVRHTPRLACAVATTLLHDGHQLHRIAGTWVSSMCM